MDSILTHHWQMGQTRLNFGEALVPSIVEHFGFRYLPDLPIHSHRSKFKLLTISSEFNCNFIAKLSRQQHHVVVWGSGYSEGGIPARTAADIRALRGTRTMELLGINDVVTCDPGFLIAEIFPNESSPTKGELWAPHWSNRKRIGWAGTELFDVEVRRSKLREEIDRLCQSSFIYTSSIHVAVACMAYRIPFATCLADEDTINKPFKWADLWSTLNVPHLWCRSKETAHNWYDAFGSKIQLPNLDLLKAAFPRDICSIFK